LKKSILRITSSSDFFFFTTLAEGSFRHPVLRQLKQHAGFVIKTEALSEHAGKLATSSEDVFFWPKNHSSTFCFRAKN
jgi:hypothetical protein